MIFFCDLQIQMTFDAGNEYQHQRSNSNPRASRICNPSNDVMSRISSPNLKTMIARSFAPERKSYKCSFGEETNSPLIARCSQMSSAFIESANQSTIEDMKYMEFSEREPGKKNEYPSVIINGNLVDVNDVVKHIINNNAFSSPVDDPSPVSYICPFSFVPILCPGRGQNCKHSQCFDIIEFLIMQSSNDAEWKCPICNQSFNISTISFDPFFFKPRKPEVITTRSPPPLSNFF